MNTGAWVKATFAKKNVSIDYNSIFSPLSVFASALASLSGRRRHAGSWGIYKAFLPCACECDPVITTDDWTLFHRSCIYTARCAYVCAFSALLRTHTFSRSTCTRILYVGVGVFVKQTRWRNSSRTRGIYVSLSRAPSWEKSPIPCRLLVPLYQWNLRASPRISKLLALQLCGRDLAKCRM